LSSVPRKYWAPVEPPVPVLPPDLPLHHQHVSCAPVRKSLVVIEQGLAEIEQVAVPLTIPEDVQQRWRSAALDQRAQCIGKRWLVEAALQPAHLVGRALDSRQVLRLFEA